MRFTGNLDRMPPDAQGMLPELTARQVYQHTHICRDIRGLCALEKSDLIIQAAANTFQEIRPGVLLRTRRSPFGRQSE